MLFTIRHHTHYHYSRPVRFSPQRLRFHPRDDGAQQVIEHQLNITPTPLGRNEHLDLEGNRVTQIWFEEAADHLDIEVNMQIETLRGMPSISSWRRKRRFYLSTMSMTLSVRGPIWSVSNPTIPSPPSLPNSVWPSIAIR